MLDANGAAVAGALVGLRNEQTGATLLAVSASDGAFSLAPPPGDYTLSVFAAGFAKSEATHVHVNADEAARTVLVTS